MLPSRSCRTFPFPSSLPRSPLQQRYYSLLSSHTATGAPNTSRLRRYGRRAAYTALGVGLIYGWDKTMNASSIGRNLRTLYTCAAITIDYKINFTQEKSELIPELHQRVADRMYDLFTKNGGLYIKIGQAIGANAGFLPKAVMAKFSALFDDAPQVPYEDVLRVFKQEFNGQTPEDVFEWFDHEAIASASIAQVHRAKLKTGELVAVKVQKPDVAIQVKWDLGAYRMVMWMFENWAFDLPVYFVVDFISDHLKRELDFELEADNAMRTKGFISAEPRLSDNVYIPTVFSEFTTKRVMTAEWIEGVRLSNKQGVIDLVESKQLKGGVKTIMNTMVELFSAQMFTWGWVHCDPHPGNVIIRPHPSRPQHSQLVLLDHGLYVHVDEKFRLEWSGLWKGLLAGDFAIVQEITRSWGVGLPDLFATATLMRPTRLRRKDKEAQRKMELEQSQVQKLSQYEQSVIMKAKLKEFLSETDLMPKALLFILRNMRIVQGNNQLYGAPVNRIKITGYWASKSLVYNPNLNFWQRAREYWHHSVFWGSMLTLDLVFWLSKVRGAIYEKLGRKRILTFEDELEQGMRAFAKGNYGVDVDPAVFSG